MPKFDAAEVAKKFNDEIQAGVATAKAAGRGAPLLVGFLANDDTAAGVYVRMTQRACEKTGVAFELRRVARVDIEAAVIAANKEARVHGIIIYYPIFGGPIDDYLRDVIGLEKDVEGLNHRYRYSLYHNIRTIDNDAGKKCVLPCTPLAVIKIMEYLGAYDGTGGEEDRLSARSPSFSKSSKILMFFVGVFSPRYFDPSSDYKSSRSALEATCRCA